MVDLLAADPLSTPVAAGRIARRPLAAIATDRA
jgi:hypothetical protein